MNTENLEKRLAQINFMRKQAANDPEFKKIAKEHESSIKNEMEKWESLSRERNKRPSRKRHSQKAKSTRVLGGSRIDNAIID